MISAGPASHWPGAVIAQMDARRHAPSEKTGSAGRNASRVAGNSGSSMRAPPPTA
jgi:hypothetical protein